MNNSRDLYNFVKESNAIEGITREPSTQEIEEMERFMKLPKIGIQDLEEFVKIYEPRARLRDCYDLDVIVGSYLPPYGGPEIRQMLDDLLKSNHDAYTMHLKYEAIHPFTDCNGRSGRALWAWKVRDLSLGFLHRFYYQTLQNHHN